MATAVYWAKALKVDIAQLCNELDIDLQPQAKISDMKEAIIKSEQFDVEYTKESLNRIIEERKEKAEAEKIALERQYELEKLRLSQPTTTTSEVINIDENPRRLYTKDISKLVGKLSPGGDIQIFLALFERQAARIKIPKAEWTTYLLGLLPLEMVHLITKAKDENVEDYMFVKKLLLHQFKWTIEEFRKRFFLQRKLSTASWREYAFQLRQYLMEWLDGTETKTFDDMIELLVSNQLKYRAPDDMQKHFLDDLPKLNKVEEIVSKFEEYEAVRPRKRAEVKIEPKKNWNSTVSQQPTKKWNNRNFEVPQRNFEARGQWSAHQQNHRSNAGQGYRNDRAGGYSNYQGAPGRKTDNSRSNKKETAPDNTHYSGIKENIGTDDIKSS